MRMMPVTNVVLPRETVREMRLYAQYNPANKIPANVTIARRIPDHRADSCLCDGMPRMKFRFTPSRPFPDGLYRV